MAVADNVSKLLTHAGWAIEHMPVGICSASSFWKIFSRVTQAKEAGRQDRAIATASRNRINYEANSSHAKIGTPVGYAAIHHFGGEAGRNNKVTIPSREILGLSADDEQEIIEIAEEWLTY